MSGPAEQPEFPVDATDLLDQLAGELAFVEPGQDVGLLPINSLVMDLEELLLSNAPPAIAAGLSAARRWLDVTSESGPENIATVARLGVRDYVTKPFRDEELLAKIGRIIPLIPREGPGT